MFQPEINENDDGHVSLHVLGMCVRPRMHIGPAGCAGSGISKARLMRILQNSGGRESVGGCSQEGWSLGADWHSRQRGQTAA